MKIGLIDVDGHARKKQFGATIFEPKQSEYAAAMAKGFGRMG